MDLAALLQQTFGFASFRPNQQAVCEAAADGRDVLLVMPTGAGKSLCYQLPALARGGTALVISPLIALMDDQAAKLSATGLRVARIHSGLSRDDARQACRDYLSGHLQFLFIAPERMRVPGFPEMLARRRPSLIAIDEAHCISQWGHDFRPDYRTLGDHLPALRPAPIIALTATATPVVQQDIVAQLRLNAPALFIHGFRRTNLAIEVVEMSKPRRNGFVIDLLKFPAARPAIVYAPSRKSAEELASLLGPTAAAYHAGLDPATRDRVQTAFLTGRTDVVVATIAFGMGIDKADVRTVVHLALPASVEGFYQEIGRAGRDGLPSRTILLQSFADRRMHEFFLERDYPAAAELARVHRLLTPDLQHPEDLARRLKMDPVVLGNALSKLASQGAATFDFDGAVRFSGSDQWRSGYDAQLAFRRRQIDNMVAFAETPQCRMTALIRHFGDTDDHLRPCGQCDHCAPADTRASTSQPPSAEQQQQLRAILRALEANGRSTGKLFTDLAQTPAFRGTDRRVFDELLNALGRAGFITLANDSFTNAEGAAITYRKATLTYEGRHPDPGDLPVTLRDAEPSAPSRSRSRKPASLASSSSSRVVSRAAADAGPDSAVFTPAQHALEAALRAWRKSEAAETGKPAFIVLSDRTLTAIVAREPRTLNDLATVAGIGPDKLERYGPAIIAICRGEHAATSTSAERASTTAGKHRSAALAALPFTTPAVRSGTRRVPAPEPASFGQARSPVPPSHGAAAAAVLQRQPFSPPDPTPLTPDQQLCEDRILAWRKREAERLGMPQFFVLNSSTVRELAQQQPATAAELRTISGIGAEKLARYTDDLLACCRRPSAPGSQPLSDTLTL